ncbi:MAG TPA: tetratricopeptide repeat protein [Gemmatimonadales bacterium]|nr:tetratricopeptide repeat protein [Gemmatimonadales bacterium]
MRPSAFAAALLPLLAAGCAWHSDITRLQAQLLDQQAAAARADSVNRASLAAIARQVQSVLDSLAAQQATVNAFRGDLRVELYNVEQQLVAVQELTGQSQQRLTELRTQLEQRSEQIAAQSPGPEPTPAAGAAPGAAAPNPAAGEPSADQLMELGLQQLRRGSPATARTAFAEFLKRYAQHPRAGDAWFFTGEAWTADQQADSAAAAYQQVVQHFPSSGHMAAALYKLGLIAVQAGKKDEARAQFNRLVASFPLSEEAALARDQLRALGPAPRPH